jgi:hypothetical protein
LNPKQHPLPQIQIAIVCQLEAVVGFGMAAAFSTARINVLLGLTIYPVSVPVRTRVAKLINKVYFLLPGKPYSDLFLSFA